jgi:hypothetical protein
MQTPPHLSRQELEQPSLSNRLGSMGNHGISCSRTQRFQEMFCVQTGCHKLHAFADHHRENLFTALVNYRDLVEVNNAIRCRRATASCSPIRDQLGDTFFRQSALKDPSLFGYFFFHRDSQHAFCLPESPICEVPSRLRILMASHSHVDFCAISSKLNLIHARSHKMNSSFTVFSHIFRYRDNTWVKSVSFVSNQDR